MDKSIRKLTENIKPATRDKCILPREMSPELAEELGIHVGDGCLIHKKYKANTSYKYSTSSGSDEIDYVRGHIFPLLKKLYNMDATIRHKRNNEITLTYCSKSLYCFKKGLGLPNGHKDDIGIPELILKSAYIVDFLRGLFDTDGCLQFKDRNKKRPPYPRLDITGKSKKLIEQVNHILLELGFTTSIVHETRLLKKTGALCPGSRVYLYGQKNLKRWIELIGFSNPKNIRKFEEWRDKQRID